MDDHPNNVRHIHGNEQPALHGNGCPGQRTHDSIDGASHVCCACHHRNDHHYICYSDVCQRLNRNHLLD